LNLKDLFNGEKTVFSFEIFPPKRDADINTIYTTLDQLHYLDPDFISVTYGASGSLANNSTCEIASAIKKQYCLEAAAHLTCVNSTREEIDIMLERLANAGIDNILALRGDRVPDVPPKEDFPHASDLIRYIRASHYDFGISAACYPEGHPDSPDMIDDIRNLKLKVDAGAEHLISQLFLDNGMFYSFLEKARIAGINVPIEAGIMPVVNKKQIERMVTLCGATLPEKFIKMMEKFEHKPEAMRDAGIAYATNQIVDLLAHGVDGIHLYTMNNPYIARRICQNVKTLF
jgi:methylenetetrahydrofolate reductase (NADPH)